MSFHHHEVVGAKLVRKRMRALKYSKQMVDDVSQLVYLHLRFHGYGEGRWTDSAVRRYVADAGPLLPRLHKLVRADCTTRNKRRAAALQSSYDSLEARIAELAAKEDLARIRPDLDGNEIMALLGIPGGPQVGEAWNYLKELRMDRGPLSRQEATDELLAWWNARGRRRRRIGHGLLPGCRRRVGLDLDRGIRMSTSTATVCWTGFGSISTVTVCSTMCWPTSTVTAGPTAPHWISTTTGCPRPATPTTGRVRWAVGGGAANRPLRWFGLDGTEHPGSETGADIDGDGVTDRLLDTDRDGLADRALRIDGPSTIGYVDTDGDGRWDVTLTDTDGDGAADGAGGL